MGTRISSLLEVLLPYTNWERMLSITRAAQLKIDVTAASYNISYMPGKLLKCMITCYSSEIKCTTAPWAMNHVCI